MRKHRNYEESCALIDRIVGRCIREADFASATLADPDSALREYDLNPGELSDFYVLRGQHHDEARDAWAAIRDRIGDLSKPSLRVN